ncbi:MAG: DUF2283 domain-containing protein [Planctomycetes bacterium]|nr:DUF2283 domain-containing protein [Planctomycetota bacterium]
MRVRIDKQADAVYLDLTGRAIESSEEVAEGIVMDYDKDGFLVGVEILDASKKAGDPEATANFHFDFPGLTQAVVK